MLDANVLIAAAPRDILLRAAEAGLFRAYWSEDILAEVERNLAKHGLTDIPGARSLVQIMREAFPDAIATGYQSLIPNLRNDIKVRHVLAAAIRARAHVIVTENLRDFPGAALEPYGIAAQSIDEFLTRLFDRESARLAQLIHEQAADLERPPLSAADVLDAIAERAPEFVALVAPLVL